MKKSKSEKKRNKKITKKIKKFRKQYYYFDLLVSEIESNIEIFINKKNCPKFNPTSSKKYRLHIWVKAIPITTEEKETLLKYLEIKYLSNISGNYLEIKSIPLLPYFYICSKKFYF